MDEAGRVSQNLTFKQQHKKKSGKQEGLWLYINYQLDALTIIYS